MMIILDSNDVASLSPALRAELLQRFGAAPPAPAPVPLDPEMFDDFDMSDVVDLTFSQVETWMEAASDKTKAGIRAIAEHGPIIEGARLHEAGVENVRHFQSRTTVRTRTVTGQKNTYLLGWDDNWDYDADGKVISGRYAVTPTTLRSLRRYFKLPEVQS